MNITPETYNYNSLRILLYREYLIYFKARAENFFDLHFFLSLVAWWFLDGLLMLDNFISFELTIFMHKLFDIFGSNDDRSRVKRLKYRNLFKIYLITMDANKMCNYKWEWLFKTLGANTYSVRVCVCICACTD